MIEQDLPILCGQALRKYRHVCAIFNTSDEVKEIIGDFLAEGYRRGHKTLAMVDPDLTDFHTQNLKERGIEVKDGLAHNFSLTTWHATYLREGKFTAESMVDFIDKSMRGAREAGHSCVWAAGDMNWAGKNPENSLELIKYESQLNSLKPTYEEDTWVCFYDANLFNGRVISDIIRAHPVVLLGKNVFENPCYVEPSEFLKELADWELAKPLRPAS